LLLLFLSKDADDLLDGILLRISLWLLLSLLILRLLRAGIFAQQSTQQASNRASGIVAVGY
jgi:hypothetical protein